jgi:Serine carboxypeptidase S28
MERFAILLVAACLSLWAVRGDDPESPVFSPSEDLVLFDASFSSSTSLERSPGYYLAQLVDHIASNGDGDDDRWSKYAGKTWAHRFYSMGTHFGGPGSPIFVFMGGEGAIEPQNSLHYPFVTDRLAPLFRAFILHPEHRFYGASQPISSEEIRNEAKRTGVDPRTELLTSEQALHDYMRLIRAVRDHLGCSRDKFSSTYCPVVTIGGSYPGFLSAMARLLFPYVVDMAYAASAPMKFYAQQVTQDAYYDHITGATDRAFPGCAQVVRTSLDDVADFYRHDAAAQFADDASKVGICEGTVPEYCLQGDADGFVNELVMMAGYTFANMNMAYYPPSPETSLGRACHTFTDANLTSLQKVAKFFVDELGGGGRNAAAFDASSSSSSSSCFNMSAQLPTGTNATITSGDWSGVGTGPSGESWDFQTCTLLVETIGFGNSSMFPPRPWSIEWLNRHCRDRFQGVVPQPLQLVQSWKFDDLVASGASNILFTNGLVDGWSVSGIQENVSDTVLAINFPAGAHHSDLSYYHGNDGEDDNATDDIRHGRGQIQTILSTWLAALPN